MSTNGVLNDKKVQFKFIKNIYNCIWHHLSQKHLLWIKNGPGI